MEYLSNIGADGLVASAKVSPADLEMELLQKCNYVFSAAIPSSILAQREGEVAEYVANCLKAGTDRRFFMTTEWEVPNNTPPANIHEIMRVITQPS